MCVGYKNVYIQRTFFKIIFHEVIAQGFYAGSQINNNEFFAGTNFKAGSITPKFYGIAPGTGDGSPYSPKTDR
jgi:hypothetical protein